MNLPGRLQDVATLLGADPRVLLPLGTPPAIADLLFDSAFHSDDPTRLSAIAADTYVRNGYRRERLADQPFDHLLTVARLARREFSVIDGEIARLQRRRATLGALVGAL